MIHGQHLTSTWHLTLLFHDGQKTVESRVSGVGGGQEGGKLGQSSDVQQWAKEPGAVRGWSFA